MNSTTRERRRWHRQLRKDLSELPPRCEMNFPGCMGGYMLTIAHSMKRRFIRTEADYREAAIACIPCHDRLDLKMSHTEMREAVLEAIRSRQMEEKNEYR